MAGEREGMGTYVLSLNRYLTHLYVVCRHFISPYVAVSRPYPIVGILPYHQGPISGERVTLPLGRYLRKRVKVCSGLQANLTFFVTVQNLK